MVDNDGNRVKFHVTTDTTPTAYYLVDGKKKAWEAEEFHSLEEWLRQQEDALGAEAETEKGHAADQPSGESAMQAEKGHATDQLSGEKAAQAEKGHAADEPSGEKAAQAEKGHAGEKATQGSGGWTQKLWSASDPARKKAPRSSVGEPIVGDESDTDIVEEWSDESGTIAHRIRAVRRSERTPEPDLQMAKEEAQRKMQARKAEDKKIFDGLRRRYKRLAAENEANLIHGSGKQKGHKW